ncbi:MAG: hypothetical protein KGV44_00885 [Flavobacteriaceae bacterium]|nr:hypothetical protein [Flavobacteriaceae bacterium]
MIEKFRQINDDWFLSEPLLFAVLCTHKLVENNQMTARMRVGKMQIEYNSEKLKKCTLEEVTDILKIEIIRIILKHPYQRQPYNPIKKALAISSDIVISANYKTNEKLFSAQDFELSAEGSFEEYYTFFANYFTPDSKLPLRLSKSSRELESLSALWIEDNLAEIGINDLIKQAQITNSWGSLSQDIVAMIEASLSVKMDYRKILNSFRASVISSKRNLTRMRPSRRYGFECLGSKNDFATQLLVAIDVSGSVTDSDLQKFFSVVNRFFKYGIKQIDVIQFDCEIKGDVIPFENAEKQIAIKGRGGTDFQPIFNYICNNSTYDGLLIFTDGFAPKPILKQKIQTKILWVLNDERNYNSHKNWIENMPKSRAVWIP